MMVSAAHAQSTMNGISFNKYKNFDKKWKLVTVRYRKDNEEIRFIYGNEKAIKVLNSGKTNYPDGAIFGKVAYKSEEDSLFPSSVIPKSQRRYQLMIMDKKKYSSTHGWGYALFDGNGVIFPEDVKTQTEACNSCHELAIERGYVFADFITPKRAKVDNAKHLMENNFKEISKNDLPENVLKHVPPEVGKAMIYSGPLTVKVFQGVLDELKPLLIKVVLDKKIPALFLSDDKTKFTLVLPENLDAKCNDGGKEGMFLHAIWSTTENEVGQLHFCSSAK